MAVLGRTRDFGKLAEKISRRHFLDGMRDDEGRLQLGLDGMPLMAPAVPNREALKAALAGLTAKSLLTTFRFRWGQKEQRAYAPFGMPWLSCAAHWTAEHGPAEARLSEQQCLRELAVYAQPADNRILAQPEYAEHPFFDPERFFFPDGSEPPEPPAGSTRSGRPSRNRLSQLTTLA